MLDIFDCCFGQAIGFWVVWAGQLMCDAHGLAPILEWSSELWSSIRSESQWCALQIHPTLHFVGDRSCAEGIELVNEWETAVPVNHDEIMSSSGLKQVHTNVTHGMHLRNMSSVLLVSFLPLQFG